MSDSDDLRTFIREVLLRFERAMERVDRTMERFDRTMERFDRRMDEHRKESRRYFEAADKERRRYFEAIRAEQAADREKLDQILAEGRAGRQALFHLLDDLRGNGGTAPAG